MPASERLIAMLRHHEGLRLTAYRDTAGALTIGYGHNLESAPTFEGAPIPRRIGTSFANALLISDILSIQHLAEKTFPWFGPLDPSPRYDAISDLAFNLGVHHLAHEFPRFCTACAEGMWRAAAGKLRGTRWEKQVGERAQTIIKMIETNAYPEELSHA